MNNGSENSPRPGPESVSVEQQYPQEPVAVSPLEADPSDSLQDPGASPEGGSEPPTQEGILPPDDFAGETPLPIDTLPQIMSPADIDSAVAALQEIDQSYLQDAYDLFISEDGDPNKKVQAFDALSPELQRLLAQKLASNNKIDPETFQAVLAQIEAAETGGEISDSVDYGTEIEEAQSLIDDISLTDDPAEKRALLKTLSKINWKALPGKTVKVGGVTILVTGGIVAALFLLLAMAHGGGGRGR